MLLSSCPPALQEQLVQQRREEREAAEKAASVPRPVRILPLVLNPDDTFGLAEPEAPPGAPGQVELASLEQQPQQGQQPQQQQLQRSDSGSQAAGQQPFAGGGGDGSSRHVQVVMVLPGQAAFTRVTIDPARQPSGAL